MCSRFPYCLAHAPPGCRPARAQAFLPAPNPPPSPTLPPRRSACLAAPRALALWLLLEFAIVAVDIQKTVGCAQGLAMPSQDQVPLWAGALARWPGVARGGGRVPEQAPGGRGAGCREQRELFPRAARVRPLLPPAGPPGCIIVSCSALLLLLLERCGARWLEALFSTIIGSACRAGCGGLPVAACMLAGGMISNSSGLAATQLRLHAETEWSLLLGGSVGHAACHTVTCSPGSLLSAQQSPAQPRPAVEAVAMAVNFFRAGLPAKEVALGESRHDLACKRACWRCRMRVGAGAAAQASGESTSTSSSVCGMPCLALEAGAGRPACRA